MDTAPENESETLDADEASESNNSSSPRRGVSKLHAGLLGLLAAMGGVAVAELVAAAFSVPGPLVAVANRVIELSPPWLVEIGKDLFGTRQKTALGVGVAITTAIVGFLSLRGSDLKKFRLVLSVFGVISLLALLTDSMSSTAGAIGLSVIAVVIALAIAIVGLNLLTRPLATESVEQGTTRRQVLTFLGATTLFAVASGVGAFVLRGASKVNEIRESISLRNPSNPEILTEIADAEAAQLTDATLNEQISDYITPTEDFYLIDTAFVKPSVDTDEWTLTVGGMVDNELTINYEELVEMSTMVAPVTLSCVSNQIGGGLVGNAVWQGVELSKVLDMAGVQSGAEQLASRSVDDWNCGFPVEAAFDGRTAMIAVGMNGEPLDQSHGFPARLVVSGLYGYVSATKWLEEITLTTWDGFDGYWIPRGWAKQGPVKLQSRIDVLDSNVSGSVPIAGVAWAPNTGVERIELRMIPSDADGADPDLTLDENQQWVEAEIGPSVNKDTWVQWRYDWDVASFAEQAGIGSGREVIVQVRATDANGETQPEEITEVAPDGATGFHTRRTRISA